MAGRDKASRGHGDIRLNSATNHSVPRPNAPDPGKEGGEELELGYMHQHRPVSNGIVGEHNNTLQVTINSSAPLSWLTKLRH